MSKADDLKAEYDAALEVAELEDELVTLKTSGKDTDRLREVNEAVVATYLAGGNTRRLRGALSPLLKAAPLSNSAVSRIVGTLKADLEVSAT